MIDETFFDGYKVCTRTVKRPQAFKSIEDKDTGTDETIKQIADSKYVEQIDKGVILHTDWGDGFEKGVEYILAQLSIQKSTIPVGTVDQNEKKHFYLSKVFLSPDSMKSMAAIQCKIKLNGEYGIRISDCNKTIKIWGNIETDKDEALEKIDSLITELRKFRNHIKVNYED